MKPTKIALEFMVKHWKSNNDNKETGNTKGMGREDVGGCFRLGGRDSPSEEKKFKLGQKSEKEPTMCRGEGGVGMGTRWANIMDKCPEVRECLAHENGEGQCGALGVRDEKMG